MRKLSYILLSVLTLSSAAASARIHELQDFLKGTTWCFQESDGPRANGRIQLNANGTGKFDVVDAPGNGGIALTWETWEGWNDQEIIIRYASGFRPRKQWANVVIMDDDFMIWTWTSTDGSVTFVNRCAPATPRPRARR